MGNLYHQVSCQQNLQFFWNSIFIQWCHMLCSKQTQAINSLLSFFWRNVNFFCFVCFFLFFWFAYWSNFISYFIFNQVKYFQSNYSFRRSFCCIYSCFCCSIDCLPYLSPHFLTNDKNPHPLTYSLNRRSVKYLISIMTTQ